MDNFSQLLGQVLDFLTLDSTQKSNIVNKYESIVLQKTANLLLDNPELKAFIDQNQNLAEPQFSQKFLELTSTNEKAATYLFSGLTVLNDIINTLLLDSSENDKQHIAQILNSNQRFVDLNRLYLETLKKGPDSL